MLTFVCRSMGLFCLLLGGVICGVAQSGDVPDRDFRFGKVPVEEFALSAPRRDSAAAALKIFDVGHCDFKFSDNRGFTYVFTRHVRYKVFNQQGYDLGNFEIALYRSSSGSAKENVVSMDAATYNLENERIIKSELEKDAKFTERLDKNYTIKKYALPNVREGSIIEFRYTIESDFIFNLRGWAFQGDLPTLWSEYHVKIPEYFQYKLDMRGYWPVSKPIDQQDNVAYVPGLNSRAHYTKYVAQDVPALKDEPFVTTLDDYLTKISFELQGTRFPNEPYQNYTGTWPKIVSALMDDRNFGQYMNKKAHAKSVLEHIPLANHNELSKIRHIHNHLKAHVKWNDDYNLYTDHLTPKTLFEKRVGNSADINLALVSLLKAAGIVAYPVLVSTRENGTHPGYPVISKFNNVVAVAVLDSTMLVLDACDPLLPIGMLSFQNLCHEGFLVDTEKKDGRWISLEAVQGGESSYYYNLDLNADLSLTGNIFEVHKGYSGLSRRNRYRSKSSESEYIKDYQEDRSGLDITSYEIGNLDSLDKALNEKLSVAIEDHVEEAGNLIYFSPLLYERTKENPFKHEERNFPVDFGFPMKENYRIMLKFPENYAVEKLPKSVIYRLPDDNGSFTISYLSEGNNLAVTSVIHLKKGWYSAAEYFELKELFKIITERQAEQIVLKKL